MGWSLPVNVNKKNYEYAKYCVNIAKATFVCGYTMKTKKIDHKQYCKHFVAESEFRAKIRLYTQKNIKDLEQKIADYEQQLVTET